ncbi:MAG TPA: hypothetical protein VJV78_29360 [Polyangiales bacterium]|nr:hypothetical protein [Polyangiales bacterium]
MSHATRLVALAFMLLCASNAASARELLVQLKLSIAPSVPEQQARRLRSAFAAQLIDVAWVQADADPGEPAPTYVVLIERTDQGLLLRFADAAGTTLATPRVVESTSDELSASEAASIARAFLVAQAEQAPVTPAQAEPASAPPTPALSPAADGDTGTRALASWSGWLSVLYSGTTYAPELAWHSGVTGEAAFKLGVWYVGASYSFYPTVEITGEPATVHLTQHDFGAFIGVGHAGDALGGSVELGVGLSDTLRATTSAEPELDQLDDSALLSGRALLRVRGRVRILPGLALDLAPGLEVVVGAHPLVVDEGAQKTDLLRPNLVRVRCDIGVSVDFL